MLVDNGETRFRSRLETLVCQSKLSQSSVAGQDGLIGFATSSQGDNDTDVSASSARNDGALAGALKASGLRRRKHLAQEAAGWLKGPP